MLRRVPVLPTLIVLAAVAVMVGLGFWQLERRSLKNQMVMRYSAALTQEQVEATPADALRMGRSEDVYYRKARLRCQQVVGWQAVAGSNDRGQTGFAHVARCKSGDWIAFDAPHPEFDAVLGWSNNPATPKWTGGEVAGRVSPGGQLGYRLVADPPLAGLRSNAPPDPANLPNNHLAYAVQWFFFALTALVIYALALRKRLNPPRNGEGDHPQDGGGVGS